MKRATVVRLLAGMALAPAMWACGGSDEGTVAGNGVSTAQAARNIIFIQGDGMGPEHIRAGRIFRNGPDVPLTFESISPPAMIDTSSLSTNPEDPDGTATDSAAAATAFATGERVQNGNISTRPNGEVLTTIAEIARTMGKAVGVISTSYVHDASPSAFVAHNLDRDNHQDLIEDMYKRMKPEIMLGGGRATWEGLGAIDAARAEGYTFAGTASELAAIDLNHTDRVLGLFTGDLNATDNLLINLLMPLVAGESLSLEAGRDGSQTDPRLPELLAAGLDRLEENPAGFFLFVENEFTDTLSHLAGALDTILGEGSGDLLLPLLVDEVALLDETVETALNWIGRQALPEETLLLVAADHETGGLEVEPGEYQKGDVVSVRWTYGLGHTSTRTAIFATGFGSDQVHTAALNTDLFHAMRDAQAGEP
jgi:alkaline phosphatase